MKFGGKVAPKAAKNWLAIGRSRSKVKENENAFLAISSYGEMLQMQQ